MFKKSSNIKKVLLACLIIFSSFFIVSCNSSLDAFDDDSVIVFKNVNVIPMNTETVLENYNVIIKDGKIVKLGKAWKTRVPKNATVIDGKGKYLTPGLFDMHVHIWLDDELELYLANGVTGVRDMFGNFGRLSLKKKIEEGHILGPRLYVASPILDGDPPYWEGSTVITSPQDGEGYVKTYKGMGYDFIKIYEGLTNYVYAAIIEAAKEEDIPVVGHVPSLVDIKKALQSGQKSIEHLDKYTDSEDLYNMTIENNVWNCLTIVLYTNRILPLLGEKVAGIEYVDPRSVSIWGVRMGLPRGSAVQYVESNEYIADSLPQETIDYYVERIQSIIEDQKTLTKNLYDKGARILLGTDANNPFVVPGFSVHDELHNLVDAGLTPYEAIKAGTYDAAEFLNILEEAGSVEENKNADLILLDGNPLEDISNMRNIEGVMVRGQWISKSEIENMLKSRIEKQGGEK